MKILQASEWAQVKQLQWKICKIYKEDEHVIESEIRSDLSQLHPELCASLHELFVFPRI